MVIIMCSQRFPQFPRNKSKVVAFFSFSSGYIFLFFTEFKLSLRVRPTEGADFLRSSQIQANFWKPESSSPSCSRKLPWYCVLNVYLGL